MYNRNNLMRPTLITFEEVMFHAPTKHTVDRRMIEQSIIIAEERFVGPEIGFEFYTYMANAKNTLVTSGNIAAMQIEVNKNVNPDDQITLVEGDLVNAYELLPPSYSSLWKQSLWKLLAECVMFTALPEGFVQFSSEGAFHTVPPAGLMVTSGLVTPLLPSMKWMMDKKAQDRIAPLIAALHRQICAAKDNYIYYRKLCKSCDEEGVEKWTGIAFGVYEQDEEEGECCY